MKQHTERFIETITKIGRHLDCIITYTLNGQNHILDSNKLVTISPVIQGDILKSVMKQLNFSATEQIPVGTIVNLRIGVLVNNALKVKEVNAMKVKRLNELPVNMLAAELKGFEYLDYGNYIIKEEPTYNADLGTYSYVCYDKMLYSMQKYEDLGVTYPITVRNYINAICTKLGLTFKDINTNFANYNRQIPNELYLDADGNDLGYTYRDVLDQLAQVTASTICINEATDKLEIRYIGNTSTTIDENFLKDVNVGIKEKYGPINSIVLSRSAESDNVYLRDEASVTQNGLCEIKIVDNQIMNWNDRSDYLPDILQKLDGLEYYTNDFNSTGILWYELCDRYNVSIDNTTYSCVLLNDEINVQQGLEELIHTDMPKQSVTNYKKADKTDRKINQTTLIVNKQEQKIESLITQVGDRSQKQTSITQDIDSINSTVEAIVDVTEEKESNTGTLTFQRINTSEPIYIEIRPIGETIDYLYPNSNLKPANNLYIKLRKIRFTNTTTNENIDFDLPGGLLYYNSQNYDTFILDYANKKMKINKKCKYNNDGSVAILDTARVDEYDYPEINLPEGNYTVKILKYEDTAYSCYAKVKLMKINEYTQQFTTEASVNSQIEQTAQEINLEVRKKVNENEVISKINQSAEQIQIQADKISLQRKTNKFDRR